MVSIRHYMDIVEDASASLLTFGDVSTPLGNGSIMKIADDDVYVDLEDGGGIKKFDSKEVRSIQKQRRTDMPSPKKDYSFTPAQQAAGRSKPILKS
jgi:hypothetical protein